MLMTCTTPEIPLSTTDQNWTTGVNAQIEHNDFEHIKVIFKASFSF